MSRAAMKFFPPSLVYLQFVAYIFLTPSIHGNSINDTSNALQYPTSSGNLTLNAGSDIQEYTVFPSKPWSVTEILQTIRIYAVEGSVETQWSDECPESGNVLFWRLRATESNAEDLKNALGLSVSELCVVLENPR